MTVRAEMAQVKSAALSGAGTVAVVAPPLKSHQTTSSADSAQIRPSKLSDYLCLTKPEVTFLVLIATALGGYMAVESPDILAPVPCGFRYRAGCWRNGGSQPLY